MRLVVEQHKKSGRGEGSGGGQNKEKKLPKTDIRINSKTWKTAR